MKNLLTVGGATRNVGKTSFIEKLIRKFGKENKIISVKIKTIYPNDNYFHGKDSYPLAKSETYRITEVKSENNMSDSARMLKAGAYKAFKIKTKAENLFDAFTKFMNQIDKDVFIICESNSLRFYIKPAVYLFLKLEDSDIIKPSAEKLFALADKIIVSDGKQHNFNFNLLKIKNISWLLDLESGNKN